MNEGRSTGAIFIDLSKAFDTLSHSQIITNLKNYGIVGIENDLFTNYLFNRQQAVNFNKTMSHYEAVTCGVPQGSILGPLLFLISFNDVEESLQYCNIIMYADDTVIFTSGKSLKEIEESLTSDFNRIANWMTENELVINTKKGKTECMLFGTPQRTKEQTLDIVYQLNKIGSTNTYKYLGVKTRLFLATDRTPLIHLQKGFRTAVSSWKNKKPTYKKSSIGYLQFLVASIVYILFHPHVQLN